MMLTSINKKISFLSGKAIPIAALALGFCLSGTNTLMAQDVVATEGDGGKARISLSGKLGMLSQMIGAESCYISAGIDTELHQKALADARNSFETILSALENGDVVLGVPSAERSSQALKEMADLDDILTEINPALDALMSGQNMSQSLSVVQASNATMLELTTILASQITGIYSNPNELSQLDAVAINIAGRQRMFSQQLKKLACELSLDPNNAEANASLVEVMDLFGLSLTALRDGLPAAGVRVPPNEGIREELDRAWERWNAVSESLQSVAADGSGDLSQINTLTDALLLNMDNVVTRYLISVPGSEDIFRVPLRAYAENELINWFNDPIVIEAILAQNIANANLTLDEIDVLDKQWRAETKMIIRPLIDEVMARPSSEYLLGKQDTAAGFVTEVFVMDNRGLNVGQSAVTSDYWQGDEDKWQLTYDAKDGGIHISEAEFDDSTQAYQAQVSFPIYDPASGDKIGAVTLGVNLQLLL